MKRRILLLVIGIIGIIIILATSTYAVFYRKDALANSEDYTTGNLTIVLDNSSSGYGNAITLNNAFPKTDSEGMSSNPYRFRITNNGNLDYKFNLTLSGSGTLSYSYIKIMVNDSVPYVLTSNNTVVATNVVLKAGETMLINIRAWLDNNTPNSQIGKAYAANLNATGVAEIIDDSKLVLDDSGANPPDLIDGLIPVMYDTTNSRWAKADTSNKNGTYKWYDYDNKRWANAVLVSSSYRTTYKNAAAGTAIPESNILAYYVWIPRFKYKVWNISKVINTDSYNAKTVGIDIVFENRTASTGTITCNNYDFSVTNGSSLSETCTGSNGSYYTHPAFTFGEDELEGIWVGKYELSSESPTATNGGGNSITLTPRIKPNVKSWRSNTVSNFWYVVHSMQKKNNIYGLDQTKIGIDSHIISNMEWGAVSYFTYSNYGRCASGTCEEVTVNESTDFYTGANAYVTNVNMSTTGNIYGIYDMSGCAFEVVMSNMSSTLGSFVYNPKNAGSNFAYTADTNKYISTYAYDQTNASNQSAYNRSRLGDGTGELIIAAGKTWYDDGAYFLNDASSWFSRGGASTDLSITGILRFGRGAGGTGTNQSSRAVLVSLR